MTVGKPAQYRHALMASEWW